MKITTAELCEHDNTIGRIVINALSDAANEAVGPQLLTAATINKELDVKLLVNGVEVDIECVVEHWSRCIKERMHEKAVEVLDAQVRSTKELLEDIQKRASNHLESLVWAS